MYDMEITGDVQYKFPEMRCYIIMQEIRYYHTTIIFTIHLVQNNECRYIEYCASAVSQTDSFQSLALQCARNSHDDDNVDI